MYVNVYLISILKYFDIVLISDPPVHHSDQVRFMEEMEDFLNTAPQAAAQNHQQQQFNLNRLFSNSQIQTPTTLSLGSL